SREHARPRGRDVTHRKDFQGTHALGEVRSLTVEEFARRLKLASSVEDKHYAIFLGAGCSVSSGIPDASTLVRDSWLPRLRDVRAPGEDLDTWIPREFPELRGQQPSFIYGKLIDELFLDAEDRQREIEELCDGKYPSFGYATLAS